MLKFLKKPLLTLFYFVLFLPLSKAQFEVGVFAGACNYQGDLADNVVRWQETQPGFGLLIRYTPNPYITLRGNFLQGKLTGSDLRSSLPSQRPRGFTFKSTIREISFIGEYNILGQSNEKNYLGGGTLINPYIFAGLGLASNDGEPVAPPDTRPYPFPEDGALFLITLMVSAKQAIPKKTIGICLAA
jgi:hypothetical protein